jgi:hypothetical protein
MTTDSWAENEIRIAIEKEKARNNSENEGIGMNYVTSCYESALRAYKSLCEDGHSGMSWSLTVGILDRLMRECPLTPIEEDEDCWSEPDDFLHHEQCTRRFSLFREKQEDGYYKYYDIDLVATEYVYEDHVYGCGSRKGDGLCESLFGPLVTFPYYPPKERYRAYMIEFEDLCDENGNEICFVLFAERPAPRAERVDLYSFYAFTTEGPVKLNSCDVEPKLTADMQKELKQKLEYARANL